MLEGLECWKVRGLHGVPGCKVKVGAFWWPVRYVRGQETRAQRRSRRYQRTTSPGRLIQDNMSWTIEVPVM